ncbi:molybdopterin molybdotransferase MoeA [Pseudomonas sp. GD03860]|uniref:molybdopterin molybdotransferase MoeA n=1 Tax=Pseudomonas TaxID=286 RepID=UPI0023646AA9|nr:MULTISPECIES: gephyrin-like molybdotransferase Glp [Pseudomonas]MDD2056736.1 molybdopterin molybdotransferase MoeA [Pseudomonas putida]MDH0638070.1 molybdopterin molybdotransferase MoeA [Pseudomonas sp. GD03860]
MNKPALVAVDDALSQLMALAGRALLDSVETLRLADAEGRVLACDVLAIVDAPAWSNSAMDGYAFNLVEAIGFALPVSQTIFAGQAGEPLAPGTCARIFTGAPVPQGANCVQMQENCTVLEDGRIAVHGTLREGANIRLQGSETGVGQLLLGKGTVLSPVALGVLACQGIYRISVVRRLKVALLSTGNELVGEGEVPAPGQIHDSNRVVLQTLLQRMGCEVIDLGKVKDEPALIRAALERADSADLIISSGGVSVGDADCIGALLRESGEVLMWKMAIKPGKPFTFAHFNGVPFIGLPGNPGSSLVTFLILARPYILRRMGRTQVEPMRLPVACGFDWPKPGTRQEYLRVSLEQGRAVLQPNQSSGTLLSATWADGLLEVPVGVTFKAGDWLDFIPFASLME